MQELCTHLLSIDISCVALPYTYQDKTGWLTSVTYGNGFVINCTYDVFGRTTQVKYKMGNGFPL